MDLARVFINLRPEATFKGGKVNYYSLDTIAETFEGVMITPEEASAEWTRIQSEDIPKDEIKRQLVETETGAEMFRTIEDIYEFAKNGTELPQQSLDRIAHRKALRDQLK